MSVYQKTFRYLHDTRESLYDENPVACVLCGLSRPCYGFIQMHTEGCNGYDVCGSCLRSGRLAVKNLCVNEGDTETLRQQLYERMPEMPHEKREALAIERTAEVELRTPRPTVLNLFLWPAHCGDCCVYFRQVNAEDVKRLAPDGDGKTFMAAHLHFDCETVDEDFLQNVWEDQLQGFMRFYLWQCPHCSEYLLTCDSE